MEQKKMKIVVLDGYALNPNDLSWEPLMSLGDCSIYELTAPDELIERSKDADALFTNKTMITAEHMAALPNLKYIGVLATGYNVVNIDMARKKGIVVTNVPAYSTNSVAQMVFAHLLNLTNRVGYYAKENRKGRWEENRDFCYWDMPMMELHGKRMGIVGLGSIGHAVASIAVSFGMEVWAYTSKKQAELPVGVFAHTLEEVFTYSDVVSLHCPLNRNTHHMVDEKRLLSMKKKALLINTGRGPLIDEEALANALNKEVIAGAGLDVLSAEPPKHDNPLLSAKNCFITPHIAWATNEARGRLMDCVVRNFQGFLANDIVNNVAR